jgi:hypothetical protein
MKRVVGIVLVMLFLIVSATALIAAEKPKLQRSRVTTVTATVEAIDLGTRMVTLKGPRGNMITFRADERVKNLPQVKVGDQVVAKYYESWAVQVKKPGEATPGASSGGMVATAKPGEKPAGVAAREVTITATIQAIDAKVPSVTLKGPEGNVVEVRIRDPKNLENVKVGDQVVITYTEALAIAVDKAKQK